MIIPRPYQYDATDAVWDYFLHATGNPLIAMPTGTGKAVVIAMIIKRAFYEYSRQRILVLTHVKELVAQNYKKLVEDVWPGAPAGINSEGLKQRDTISPIIFGNIKSVANQLHLFGKIDLVIVDESHLISPDNKTLYRKVFAELKARNKHFKVIGLSATCFRLGQGLLTDGDNPLFTDVCYDATSMEEFNKFFEEGYLTRLVPRPTKTEIVLDGVNIVGGEFNSKQLNLAVDVDSITEAAIRETIEVAGDRKKWLIFASGIHHMQRIGEFLDFHGVSHVSVHSKMKDGERDTNLERLRNGDVQAGINFGVLTTGYDDPFIDLIVMLRPTASPVLWVQMLGRGTRPVYAPGFDVNTREGRLEAIRQGGKPDCLVLDFGGNTRRLGPINDPRIPKQKGKGGGAAPVKLCPMCNTYNHASVRFCTFCKNEFTFEVKITQEAATQNLIADSFPVIEMFEVQHVTYNEFEARGGKPAMIRTTYYTESRSFNDFVCLEHSGYPRKKAEEWWQDRIGGPVPATVKEGLLVIEMAKTPTHIKVWINKKTLPEIMGYCFDGTAFGSKTATVANPSGEVRYGHHSGIRGPLMEAMRKHDVVEEDDIPF